MQQYEKKCVSCGKEFFANRIHAKYCSELCRASYHSHLDLVNGNKVEHDTPVVDFYTRSLVDPVELEIVGKPVGFKASRLDIEPIYRDKQYRTRIARIGATDNREYDVLAFVSEAEAKDYAIQNGLYYLFGNELIIERNSVWVPSGWGMR